MDAHQQQYRIVPGPGIAKDLSNFPVNGINIDSSLYIGRSCREKNALQIPTDWVKFSSRHAHITTSNDGQLMITDTSTNGTYINDVRCPKNQPRPLKAGDTVRLSVPEHEQDPVFTFTVELAPPLGQENISPNDATPAASVGPLPSSLPNKRRKTQPPDQPLGGSQVQESPSAGDFVGINAMHVHNEKLRLELTQLNEKLLQSEQRHVAALKASQAQQQELNTLTARVVTLQADVRGREEAVVQAQQANAVLQKQLQQAQEAAQHAQHACTATQQQLAVVQAELLEAQKRTELAEGALVDMQQAQRGQQHTHEALYTEITTLKEALSAATTACQTAEVERQAALQHADNLEQQVQAQHNAMRSLQAEVTSRVAQCEELRLVHMSFVHSVKKYVQDVMCKELAAVQAEEAMQAATHAHTNAQQALMAARSRLVAQLSSTAGATTVAAAHDTTGGGGGGDNGAAAAGNRDNDASIKQHGDNNNIRNNNTVHAIHTQQDTHHQADTILHDNVQQMQCIQQHVHGNAPTAAAGGDPMHGVRNGGAATHGSVPVGGGASQEMPRVQLLQSFEQLEGVIRGVCGGEATQLIVSPPSMHDMCAPHNHQLLPIAEEDTLQHLEHGGGDGGGGGDGRNDGGNEGHACGQDTDQQQQQQQQCDAIGGHDDMHVDPVDSHGDGHRVPSADMPSSIAAALNNAPTAAAVVSLAETVSHPPGETIAAVMQQEVCIHDADQQNIDQHDIDQHDIDQHDIGHMDAARDDGQQQHATHQDELHQQQKDNQGANSTAATDSQPHGQQHGMNAAAENHAAAIMGVDVDAHDYIVNGDDQQYIKDTPHQDGGKAHDEDDGGDGDVAKQQQQQQPACDLVQHSMSATLHPTNRGRDGDNINDNGDDHDGDKAAHSFQYASGPAYINMHNNNAIDNKTHSQGASKQQQQHINAGASQYHPLISHDNTPSLQHDSQHQEHDSQQQPLVKLPHHAMASAPILKGVLQESGVTSEELPSPHSGSAPANFPQAVHAWQTGASGALVEGGVGELAPVHAFWGAHQQTPTEVAGEGEGQQDALPGGEQQDKQQWGAVLSISGGEESRRSDDDMDDEML